MRIDIPYGKGKQTLEIDEDRLTALIFPKQIAKTHATERDIVLSALENPIHSKRLCELAQGKNKILFITSDHTRPMPSHITVPLMLEEIRRGNPNADITILVGTGLHRPTTKEELIARFTRPVVEKENIVIHDAEDDDAMVFVGILPSGCELWLNRLVMEADLVISEGFIEPHFFAGYSGGRKSILPGVAAKKTVLYNHNARFIAHPLAHQGYLEGNPIHADMAFAALKAGLKFILNVLLDEEKHIAHAYAGDCTAAHARGCEQCAEIARVPACEADIVITSNGGYPLDQNVYQCVKGLTAAEKCVHRGGVIIMCAALSDGHGGDGFYHWFADRKDALEVALDIENLPPRDTRPDQWQAQILARILNKASCIFVTERENEQMLCDMHMAYAQSVGQALKMAQDMLGADALVAVIPNGVSVIIDDK